MVSTAFAGLGAACASACLLLFASPALSQALPAARAADPLDPRAPVPPAVHRSVLAGQRISADRPLTPWPDANQTVNRIGGWRTYLRESASPAASAASAPVKSAPHGHHTPQHR
jgi:hypothetical protein